MESGQQLTDPARRAASTPNRSADAGAGFTLLELMVVVVIIGLVVAGTILSLGSTGRDGQLEQERDRLAALIAYVRERGALLTLEYGIRCGQHGYRFVYYDNRTMQWLPETLDDTLRPRHLPTGLDLRLVIEGREVVLDDKALELPPSKGTADSNSLALGAAPHASTATSIDSSTSSSDLSARIDNNAPQVMLLSSGDMNSFALTVRRQSAERSITLRSVSDGTVSAGDIVEARR